MGRVSAPSGAPRDDVAPPPREAPRTSMPTSAERPAPKLDTVALVEKATAPKEIPTALAILVIVALSLVAGLATYVVRARTGTTVEPATTATTTAARATDAKRP